MSPDVNVFKGLSTPSGFGTKLPRHSVNLVHCTSLSPILQQFVTLGPFITYSEASPLYHLTNDLQPCKIWAYRLQNIQGFEKMKHKQNVACEFNLETSFLIAEASFHLYKFTGSGRRKSDLCQPSQLFLIFIDLGRLDHGACSVKCFLTYCLPRYVVCMI